MKKHWKMILWFALPFLALLGWLVGARWAAQSRLAQFKEELIQQGERLNMEDLIPEDAGEATNGARAFLAASAKLSGLPENVYWPAAMKWVAPGLARVSWREDPLVDHETPGEPTNLWPVLRAYSVTNQSVLRALRQALQQPVIQFDVNFSKGFGTLLTHLAPMKSTCQALGGSALVAMHDGQTEEAFENLHALSLWLSHYQREPLMISHLVHYAVVSIASSHLWEAMHYPDFREEQWRQLQAAWEGFDLYQGLAESLAMERACGMLEYQLCRESMDRLRDLSTGFGFGSSSGFFSDVAEIGNTMLTDPKQGLKDFVRRFPAQWGWQWIYTYDDERWYMSHLQTQIQAARLITLEDSAASTAIHLSNVGATGTSPPPTFLVSQLIGSSVYRRYLDKAIMAETQRRMVVAAIALKRYQIRQGAPPPDLESLVPDFLTELPRDPHSSEWLHYEATPEGEWILYSIGTNGVDDGGDAGVIQAGENEKYWLNLKDWVWPKPAATVTEEVD